MKLFSNHQSVSIWPFLRELGIKHCVSHFHKMALIQLSKTNMHLIYTTYNKVLICAQLIVPLYSQQYLSTVKLHLLALWTQYRYPLKKNKKKRTQYLQLTVKRVYTCRRKANFSKAGILLHCVFLVLLLRCEWGKDYRSFMRAISKSTALEERFSCCCHSTEEKKFKMLLWRTVQ